MLRRNWGLKVIKIFCVVDNFSSFLLFSNQRSAVAPPKPLSRMNKLILCSIGAICIMSCQKQMNTDRIYGEPVASEATLSDRVYSLKNTGVYSDTCSIAKTGYGIVFNGNSILERMNYSNWKATWVNKGYPVLNRAIGGTTWSEKITFIKDLTTYYKPNDIVLYDGENEFLRASGTDNTVGTKLIESFNRTVDSLRKSNPNARVYVVSMVTCPVLYKKGFAGAINKVNEGYIARVNQDAAQYPGKIKFIDIRSMYPPTASAKFEADSIHIKLTAYDEFYNALKAALPKPNTNAWGKPLADSVVKPVDSIPRTDTVVIPPVDTTVVVPPPADTIPRTDTVPRDTVPVAPASNNKLPVANAGADVTIGKSWNYNPWIYGTQSKDPDGWIASFKWTCVQGTQYTIVSPDAGKTRLDNLAIGVYVFKLTVTDNKGAVATDEVKVTVTK